MSDADFPYDLDFDIPTIVIPAEPPTEGESDAGATIQNANGTSSAATSLQYAPLGIKAMAWAQEPYRTLWCVRSDGLLIGMTYRRDQDVIAWHRHPMNNGAVEDVEVIPDPQTGQAQVWLVVRRVIGGVSKRYIERMSAPHVPVSEIDTTGFIFMDSALTYSGSPATVISGLDHLEGQTVSIWADGTRHADKTVASGSITLDRAASTVHVGLHASSFIRSLPAVVPSSNGSALGKIKTISRVRALLLQSIGGKAGMVTDRLDDLNIRAANDGLGQSPGMVTGTADVSIERTYNREGQFYIVQDIPGPMTILALLPEIDGTDY